MPDPSRPDALLVESLRDRGFGVVTDFLPEPRWRALGAEARRRHARGEFRHAGVGRGASFRVAPEIRNDAVLWIDPAAPSRLQRDWLSRVEALRQTLNRSLYLGLFGYEAHYARYAPGARYQTHVDRFSDASHRVLSLVLYLNEDWTEADGGALRLYLGEPDAAPWHDVEPRGGTLVAFLSEGLHHEVLPAKRERTSLVGWLTSRPAEPQRIRAPR